MALRAIDEKKILNLKNGMEKVFIHKVCRDYPDPIHPETECSKISAGKKFRIFLFMLLILFLMMGTFTIFFDTF